MASSLSFLDWSQSDPENHVTAIELRIAVTATKLRAMILAAPACINNVFIPDMSIRSEKPVSSVHRCCSAIKESPDPMRPPQNIMSLTSALVPYCLTSLGNLQVGHAISAIKYAEYDPSAQRPSSWYNGGNLAPGVYNLKRVVYENSPILDAVVQRLVPDAKSSREADKELLIKGLQASLAMSGRESTFPIANVAHDTSRKEIADQAERINKTILQYVNEAPSASDENGLQIRSNCDGHLWTVPVASLLLGRRSNGQLMQLYNEWLHRMVLLRDSLLAFENYDEVPLIFEAGRAGLRQAEGPRQNFMVKCMTGQISNRAVVDFAKTMTASHLPSGGYGFQYSQGLVLPAFLSGSDSRGLLRWHPSHMEDSKTNFILDYEHADYMTESQQTLSAVDQSHTITPEDDVRQQLSSPLFSQQTSATQSALRMMPGEESSKRIGKLDLTLDTGICASVDLGMVTRGKRYAYESGEDVTVSGMDLPSQNEEENATIYMVHRTADLFSAPGLIASPRVTEGSNVVHIIPAEDPVVKLALLGKLYPENVILANGADDLHGARFVGKNFSERLVIWSKARD